MGGPLTAMASLDAEAKDTTKGVWMEKLLRLLVIGVTL
jgi:hypothetical protein